ncbi:poly-beta-1,6-N-acetyl-D-glucosamine biosynthesis protein PgaD [Bacillus ectoiniformans]|uniref:poly-beta-1,6-N-acetyl-D-glucosamine biosynthesis protein PgaD n=1 Tax=Bacillus ectoiniformans TaxID=1494429 RepID=UPI001956BEC2|nr:poly-beta-1,6-N-acetyl-D-glucosamine biosynthesis protein PgaD [Bacillus ectoiniformans]MBM7649914.1 poly-beta-1,6-N-acetyl-D-glucosamine biosynthesis protein PgaD [Bacillus ectoiniformans]
MIIQKESSILRSILEGIITLLGWLFLATFLFYLIINFEWGISFKFYSLTLANVNAILLFTLIMALLCVALLMAWSTYNKKKFGHLRRRKFPSPTTTKEILDYYQISEEQLEKIQEEKYVEVD